MGASKGDTGSLNYSSFGVISSIWRFPTFGVNTILWVPIKRIIVF